MSTPILQIDHLTKTYKTGSSPVHALNGVTLDLHEGEIFGLLGVNGAGKTTLSSIIATLHPPTSGDIRYKGISIYKDLMRYRHALGYCPQNQNLDQYLNVRDNLVFAGRYFLMPKAVINARVDELLEQLELTRYAEFKISELSGGTKQRVLIARALMHNPRIIILDEPTVGLDPDIRQKLWALIKALKNQGISIILTTHYLDEAEELSDRICILHKGSVKLIESVQSLKERHQQSSLERIFLQLMREYRMQQE
jgi:ABC-2 type transport system ATP-binding protein